MSKFDSMWTEEQAAQAAAEGWQLAITVDEGKPIKTAYFHIYDMGPRFENRAQAYQHVLGEAYKGSKLCISAMSACVASRQQTPQKTARKRSAA